MLPKEAIKQFKDLYLRHYKVELSDEEASLRANNLLSLYEAVYGDRLDGRINDNEQNGDKPKSK